MPVVPARGESVSRPGPPQPSLQAAEAGRRWALALGVCGSVLFASSYALPWWNYHFVTLRVPQGLFAQMALTGIGSSFDGINPVRGTPGPSAAAVVERAAAGWVASAVCLGALCVLLGLGRKIGWTDLVPAIGLPVAFVVDTSWWMWQFGGKADPAMPVGVPEFTALLRGYGATERFLAWAWPAEGLWVASAGIAAVAIAGYLRLRVCHGCPLASDCGPPCPSHLALDP